MALQEKETDEGGEERGLKLSQGSGLKSLRLRGLEGGGGACSAMGRDAAPADVFCLGDMDSCYATDTFATNYDRLCGVLQAVQDESVSGAIVKTLRQNRNNAAR